VCRMLATRLHREGSSRGEWVERIAPALLVPLIGLVAAWPFLTQSLPSTDDGALHLLRLAEIDRCLRHGVLPLRWAPDFAHGYGYPFFNYYASLSSYLAELWRIVGLSFPGAIAAATVSALVFSGWGACLLGRDLGGPKAGLIAATAYMYAPYQFYDSAYRGNLAESWALALLPWVLWTARQAALRARWREIVPLALAYGALLYTHNVYALISSPVLGLYLLLLWWTGRRSWRDALRLGTAIALGLALSAFFWLPMFFERGWTRFSTGLVDYRTFFLPLQELLAQPPQVDLALLNYYPPRSLSWGMLVLAILGILSTLLTARKARSASAADSRASHLSQGAGARVELLYFAFVFLGTAFLTIRPSDWVWRTVPLLNFALIPWRYLGLASLAGSLVAGMAVAALPERADIASPALIATGAAILLLVAASIAWTYAAPFPQRQELGVAEIVGWEYSSKLIGTTAKNEFLPIWSPQLPPEPADPVLLTEYDPIIARLDETSLPEGARVLSAHYALMRGDLTIDTPRAFRALYKQLYFPGWQVTVDGRAVNPIARAPYGLLGFDVPAGRHRIVIAPTATPLRSLGQGIALLGVLAAIAVLAFDRPRLSASVRSGPGSLSPPGTAGAGRGHWLYVAALALLILSLKEGVIDRTENVFRARRFDGAHLPGVQTEAQVNFGDLLTLLGYDLPSRPTAAGQPLRVDLYLSARQAIEGQYAAYARLVDDQGRLWSLSDNGAPEGHRPPPSTAIWPTDAYGHWAYLTYTLPGTPPGEYWIEVGLYERDTWRTLNVLDERGLVTGLATRIGPVQIARPHTPPAVDELGLDSAAQVRLTEDLQYLGDVLGADSVQAGDALDVALFWKALRPPQANYRLRLGLVSPESAVELGADLPLGRDQYPTTQWQAGEVVRSVHRLRVPAGIQAEVYDLHVTVVESGGAAIGDIVVAQVAIRETDRLMSLPPEVKHRVEASFGQRIALAGYDLPAPDTHLQLDPGGSLPITLYWQAEREMAVSYKVFVQLVGPQGVLSQVDAVPAGWTRPTTGWLPGEVIVDPYDLSVPQNASPGTYQLIAGIYQESTMQRLAVVGTPGIAQGDHVLLAEATID
jgi:hypothetical protein